MIKPVPYGLIKNGDEDSSVAHHIVFKRKVDPVDEFSDFGKNKYPFSSSAKRILILILNS